MEETTQQIDVGLILPSPWNREVSDGKELSEITQSVREHGIIQPLILRPGRNGNEGKFELVAGERRWRAAKTVGLTTVPALVRELSDVEAIEQQAIENLQRKDLSPIDEAKKYQQLLELYEQQGAEHGTAISKLCERTGKARSTVYERLGLLKLAAPVQEIVAKGKLPPSHAALLIKLEPAQQSKMAQFIAPPDEKTAFKLEDKYKIYVERGTDLLASFRDAKELVDSQVKRAKEAAIYDFKAGEFRARGIETFTWEKAYDEEGSDLVGRDDYISEWNMYVRDLVKDLEAKQLPAYVVRPERHSPEKPELVYRKKELLSALKKAGKKPRTFGHAGASADYKAREKARLARERAKKAILQKAIPPIRTAAGKRNAKVPWGIFFHVILGNWRAHQVCRRRGWPSNYGNGAQVLAERAAKLPANQMPGILADIVIEETTRTGGYDAKFVELAKFYQVDVKALEKELTAKPEKKAKAKVQTAGKPGLSAKARERLANLMKQRWAARRKKRK